MDYMKLMVSRCCSTPVHINRAAPIEHEQPEMAVGLSSPSRLLDCIRAISKGKVTPSYK